MRAFMMTQEMYDQLIAEFSSKLINERLIDGDITYTAKIKNDKKADPLVQLEFTPEAYLKMQMLVLEFGSEVGWRGLVKRCDNENSQFKTFLVYDILVFPQTVSDVTVDTDEAKYCEWLDSLDDETFSHVRFYGHSHVNMQTSPSDVDMKERTEIVNQLKENDFVIFGIFNKYGSCDLAIYDMQDGYLYDKDDIEITVAFEDHGTLGEFIANAKLNATRTQIRTFGAPTRLTGSMAGTSYTPPQGSSYTTNASSKKESKKAKKAQRAYNFDIDDDDDYNYYTGQYYSERPF